MKSLSDLIYGRQAVLEALRSGRTINKIIVASGIKEFSIEEILKMATQKKIVVKTESRQFLDRETENDNHQGILAYAAAHEYASFEAVLDEVGKMDSPILLILDGIEDPRNFGAILRTAEAAGVSGVIIPKHRACPLNATVAKTSAGALEYLPVCRVGNLSRTIERLKKERFWVVGTTMDADNEYYNSNLSGPLVIVIGSEGKGMSRVVGEKCDFNVRIPMLGQIDSLNASVAAAIIMYEAIRQRSGE